MVMVQFNDKLSALVGPAGSLPVRADDDLTRKLAMLIEGECEGGSRARVAGTYGYSRQRYHQVLGAFRRGGAAALASRKRGPKTQYRRGGEVARQVIRHRYLDADASAEVIAQKLRQDGWKISIRSVFRVFAEFGLQKKSSTRAGRARTQRPRGP
jgi:transposase